MKKIILAFLAIAISTISTTYANNNEQNKKNEKHIVADVTTSMGNFKILLFNSTPNHRDNFVKNAKTKVYDGMRYHRIIRKFIIQIGDPNTKDLNFPRSKWGSANQGEEFAPEIDPTRIHVRGAINMAREGDKTNPQRLSSGSHFCVMHGTNRVTNEMLDKAEDRRGVKYTPEQRQAYLRDGGSPHLDGNYVVFGHVIEGMDVVDAIATTRTNENDRPYNNIFINKIKISKVSTKKLENKYSYYAK